MLEPGDLLANKLKIVRRLGAGGMGVVFEAIHVHLGRRVAVKLIRADEAKEPEARARFMAEARAQARLPLDHIVQVLDVDSLPDGALFTVLEYLDGRDLKRELRKRGTLPVAEAAYYVAQACRGASAAHAAGIVHRDLKPQNLFITNLDGERKIKLIDFGIAKFMQSGRQDLTGTDEVVGTPTHLSPEQIGGKTVDGRADVWSLGVVLYELLCGATPFRRSSALATLSAVTNDPPTPLHEYRADLPDELVKVIERCLAKPLDERYPSAHALELALAPFAAPFDGRVPEADRGPRGSSMPAGPASAELAALPVIVPPQGRPIHDLTAPTERAAPGPLPLPPELSAMPSATVKDPPPVPPARRGGSWHVWLFATTVMLAGAWAVWQARHAASASSGTERAPASIAASPLSAEAAPPTAPARSSPHTEGTATLPAPVAVDTTSVAATAAAPAPERASAPARPIRASSAPTSSANRVPAPPATPGDSVPLHL